MVPRFLHLRRTAVGGAPTRPLRNRYYDAAIQALEGRTSYDLMLVGSEYFPYRRLQDYLDDGAEFVVIDPVNLGRFLTGINHERFPAVGDFYRDLKADPRLRRVQRFESVDGPGPTLEIYRVDHAAESPGRR